MPSISGSIYTSAVSKACFHGTEPYNTAGITPKGPGRVRHDRSYLGIINASGSRIDALLRADHDAFPGRNVRVVPKD